MYMLYCFFLFIVCISIYSFRLYLLREFHFRHWLHIYASSDFFLSSPFSLLFLYFFLLFSQCFFSFFFFFIYIYIQYIYISLSLCGGIKWTLPIYYVWMEKKTKGWERESERKRGGLSGKIYIYYFTDSGYMFQGVRNLHDSFLKRKRKEYKK